MTDETMIDPTPIPTPDVVPEAELLQVHGVTATAVDGVYILDIDLEDCFGEEYRAPYVSHPDDNYGLNPTIRQWLSDNAGTYTIAPYVAPTVDELRAQMQPITPRQLRLALVRSGVSLASVQAAIDAMPAGADKDTASIEWDFATSFNRLDPVLLSLATALNLSPEQVDTMWALALTI